MTRALVPDEAPDAPLNARVRAPWHQGRVVALASRTGARVAASAGADGVVRAWDLAAHDARWQFERDARNVLLSPDARTLWAITEPFDLWPCDLVEGVELERAWTPPRRFLGVARPDRAAMSPDGRWILAAVEHVDGAVRVFDALRGAETSLVAPGAGELHPYGVFAADARSVLLLGGVREGRTGRARSALYRFTLDDAAPTEIRLLRFAQQSLRLYVAVHRERCAMSRRWLTAVDARATTLMRWDLALDEPVHWIDTREHAGPIGRFVTGERLFAAVTDQDRQVVAWSHEPFEERGRAALPEGERWTALALSDDETVLLAGTSAGRVHRWRVG